MGARLVESSPFAASCIDELDSVLQGLPNASDRPSWTLKGELLAGRESSRVAEAAPCASRPCCRLPIHIAEEARVITRDGFVAHLKRMLRISEEERLEDSATLVELGVDSLIAVDIRA